MLRVAIACWVPLYHRYRHDVSFVVAGLNRQSSRLVAPPGFPGEIHDGNPLTACGDAAPLNSRATPQYMSQCRRLGAIQLNKP